MFDIFKIFKKIRKNFKGKDSLKIISLIGLFFATRFINLVNHPIFSDEGIYIHWAKIAWHDATWRFISLTDGKQPLQTWGTIPFLKLFPNNALLAGRLFPVFGGLISLIGIFSILYYLFDKRTAFIGSLLYIFTPYFLFYERLALVDSYVNAGAIWILFLSIVLIKERQLSSALIFGFLGGMFLLAKSSVKIFFYLSVFAPILLWGEKAKSFLKKSINYYFLFFIASVIAFIIYNIQRLSPFLHYVAQKNLTFIMSFSQFLKTPFHYFSYNFKYTPLFIAWEMGFVLFFFGILGLFNLLRKKTRLGLYFSLWIILPFTAIIFLTKVLFPRYLIFFSSFFLILGSYYLSLFKKKGLVIALVLFFISIAYFDYTVLFDYKNIPFPQVDRGQYIEGWPAAWGTKDIIAFARKKTKEKPVIILAEGNFGMAGDVLDILLKPNDKITIKGYWPLGEKELENEQKNLGKNFIYAVFSHRKNFPKDWSIKLVKKYSKPNSKEAIYLFELENNPKNYLK